MSTSSNAPVTDLAELIRSMTPSILEGEYVFVECGELIGDAMATVREPEGMSFVIKREEADVRGLPYDFVAGWITLNVFSALSAVGLTAHVATVLSQEGISCNVIAGKHHDHLLVPHELTQRAFELLTASTRA